MKSKESPREELDKINAYFNQLKEIVSKVKADKKFGKKIYDSCDTLIKHIKGALGNDNTKIIEAIAEMVGHFNQLSDIAASEEKKLFSFFDSDNKGLLDYLSSIRDPLDNLRILNQKLRDKPYPKLAINFSRAINEETAKFIRGLIKEFLVEKSYGYHNVLSPFTFYEKNRKDSADRQLIEKKLSGLVDNFNQAVLAKKKVGNSAQVSLLPYKEEEKKTFKALREEVKKSEWVRNISELLWGFRGSHLKVNFYRKNAKGEIELDFYHLPWVRQIFLQSLSQGEKSLSKDYEILKKEANNFPNRKALYERVLRKEYQGEYYTPAYGEPLYYEIFDEFILNVAGGYLGSLSDYDIIRCHSRRSEMKDLTTIFSEACFNLVFQKNQELHLEDVNLISNIEPSRVMDITRLLIKLYQNLGILAANRQVILEQPESDIDLQMETPRYPLKPSSCKRSSFPTLNAHRHRVDVTEKNKESVVTYTRKADKSLTTLRKLISKLEELMLYKPLTEALSENLTIFEKHVEIIKERLNVEEHGLKLSTSAPCMPRLRLDLDFVQLGTLKKK